MVDILKWFHELIRDKGTKWVVKILYLFLILFIFYLVDDHFGWSFYSKTESQVSLIKEIDECLRDSTHSLVEKSFLEEKKLAVINRKTFTAKTIDYLSSLLVRENNKRPFFENIKYEFFHGTSIVRSYRFFLLNTGIIVVLLISFIKKLRITKPTGQKIGFFFLFIFYATVFSLIFNWLFGLIPIISKGNIWINYILYIILGAINTWAVIDTEKEESLYNM